MIRTPVSDISTMSRNTQGVRLIRLDESDRLVGVSRRGERHASRQRDGEPVIEASPKREWQEGRDDEPFADHEPEPG